MHTDSSPLQGKRFPGWLILMAALTAMSALSIDMYLPSFSFIARDLGVGSNTVELTLSTFLIGLALGQMFYGPISDRFGRKPPLYFGICLYVVSALGCALAPNIETLLALRFFQGLGGSVGMVIPRAVVRDKMGAEGSARAFSMLMLVFGLAPILAPFIGGLLLTLSTWRAIFATLVVFGAICLISTHHLMEETRDRAYVMPLHLGRVLRQYGDLLRQRQFMAYVLCGGLIQAGMFAYISGSPFVLIELHGIEPQHFGFVFGANAIGLIACSQINARLLIRRSADRVLGNIIWIPAALATAVAILIACGFESLPLLLIGFFGFLSCQGFVGPNTAAIALAQQGRQAGTAAALMGTLQFGIGMLSSVLMGWWHDGTALPLTVVMAVCGVTALLLYRYVARHTMRAVPCQT
jgi:DHA1 family bicyclomycin/chloramphenicol resistance-like MFS transporter